MNRPIPALAAMAALVVPTHLASAGNVGNPDTGAPTPSPRGLRKRKQRRPKKSKVAMSKLARRIARRQ